PFREMSTLVREALMNGDPGGDQKRAEERLDPIEREHCSRGPVPRKVAESRDGVQPDELRQADELVHRWEDCNPERGGHAAVPCGKERSVPRNLERNLVLIQ